jgi:hypothetical protein
MVMIAPLSMMEKDSRLNGPLRVCLPNAPISSCSPTSTHPIDQDARNVGCSDPSSSENSTGIISFVTTLPFRSFSATRSC